MCVVKYAKNRHKQQLLGDNMHQQKAGQARETDWHRLLTRETMRRRSSTKRGYSENFLNADMVRNPDECRFLFSCRYCGAIG